MDYRISGERLKGFADQARRLGKVGGELTPGQIEDTLKGVTAGGSEVLPIAEDTTFGYVRKTETATREEPTGKYFYSGVLLPEIPTDVLAEYPYVWIRNNTTSGHYDLFFSKIAFYLVDTDSISGADVEKPWYRVEIASANTADSWVFNKTSTANLGIDTARTVLWSNHDIPNGSAGATEIYFEGSEPITEYKTVTETIIHHDPVERESYYSITRESMNEIAKRTQKMAGTSELMTPEEIAYWLGRVIFIPQSVASSEVSLVSLVFESAIVARNPVVVKATVSSEVSLASLVFESSATGALQEG